MLKKAKKASHDAPMPVLECELLGLILSCLTESKYIICCAVVSRTWAEASKHTRNKSLMLEHTLHDGVEVARAHLRWLQGLQQEGRLDNLQEAHLLPYDLPEDEDEVQTFPSFLSQGFVVLAGTWRLREVTLYGPVCYATAVAMLPTTLVVLKLWPHTGPLVTNLSDFKRFKKLRVLQFAFGLGTSAHPHDVTEHMFLIETAFPGLKFLALHDRLRCRTSPSYDMATSLPNLQHISLRVMVNAAGAQLAHNVISLVQLRKVGLHLLDGDSTDLDLVVPAASLIEQLNVVGPHAKPRVTLDLIKSGVNYCCSNVAEVKSAHSDFDLFDASYLQPNY